MTELLGNGATRLTIAITGAISVLAAIIGAAVTFFVTNASLSNQVAVDKARLTAVESNVSTMMERNSSMTAQVSGVVARLAAIETISTNNSERVATLRTETVRIISDLREVETQFCASDTVRNLMHANDLRIQAMLWRKSFTVPYPINNAYYPEICNRFTHTGTGTPEK